jgi:hypothetical protein
MMSQPLKQGKDMSVQATTASRFNDGAEEPSVDGNIK